MRDSEWTIIFQFFKKISQNSIISIINLKKTMVIEFHLFITVWIEYRNLAPFAKRIVKFPEFEKMTEDQIFHLKKKIHGSKFRTFYYYLAVQNSFEESGKMISMRGPHFTPSKYFTKIAKCKRKAIIFLILYNFQEK